MHADLAAAWSADVARWAEGAAADVEALQPAYRKVRDVEAGGTGPVRDAVRRLAGALTDAYAALEAVSTAAGNWPPVPVDLYVPPEPEVPVEAFVLGDTEAIVTGFTDAQTEEARAALGRDDVTLADFEALGITPTRMTTN